MIAYYRLAVRSATLKYQYKVLISIYVVLLPWQPAEKIPGVKKQTEPAGVKAQALQHQKKSQDEPADCQQLVDR